MPHTNNKLSTENKVGGELQKRTNRAVTTAKLFYNGLIKAGNFIKNVPEGYQQEKVEGKGMLLKRTLLAALQKSDITPNDIVTFRLTMITVAIAVFKLTGYKLPAAALYAGLSSFDAVDGALARFANQSSKSGEIYDALADKIVVIAGDLVALGQIQNPELMKVAIVSYLANWILFYKSTKKRTGSVLSQVNIAIQSALGETDPEFTPVKTGNAANNAGKIKTILQMTSNSVLWASASDTVQKLAPETVEYVQDGAVALSCLSFFFAIMSILGKRGEKNTKCE